MTGFIEFSQNDILMLSKILRLVRKETGIPLKMSDDNFLKHLDTSMLACKNPATEQLYKEFKMKFSQRDELIRLEIVSSSQPSQRSARGAVPTPTRTSTPSAEKTQTPNSTKKKIMYRGQVKYID